MTVDLSPILRLMQQQERRIAQLERNQRYNNIAGATIEGGTLLVNDANGDQVLAIGAQPDGTFTTVATVPTAPVPPDSPIVVATILGVAVTWDGNMADGSTPLSDFDYIQVHMSTTSGFLPSSATMVGSFHEAATITVAGLAVSTNYYFCFVAINESDNTSLPGAQVAVTTLPVALSALDPAITARSLGGITTTIAATAPASPVTGDIWINTSSGNQLNQWSGSAWVAISWNAGSVLSAATITGALIAANTIAAGNIVANTITAAQLAAGIVYAGIVNGTTITGATIIADGGSGEFLVYSGTPATGNLIASVSPTTGTDAHSNTYKAGFTVYDTSSTTYVQMLAGSPAQLNVGTGDSAEATPGRVTGVVQGSGATRVIINDFQAARMTSQNVNALAEVQLISPSQDLTTSAAQVNVVAQDGTHSTALTVTPTNVSVQGTFSTTGLATLNAASVTGDTTTATLHVTGVATAEDSLVLSNISTPALVASSAVAYGNTGHQKYVGSDGVDYATGRVLATGPNNQAINTTGFTALTGMSVALGVGTYMFRILVELKANSSAGQWLLEILFSGTATVNYGFRFTSAAGVAGLNANVSAFGSSLGGPATSVLGFYWAEIEGKIVVTAAGNLSVSGATTATADTFNVFLGSYIEAFPVV